MELASDPPAPTALADHDEPEAQDARADMGADGGTDALPANPPVSEDGPTTVPVGPGDETPASSRGRVPWGPISGVVVLVYVVAWAAALSQIASRDRFDRWGDAMGALGARVLVSVVVVAALFHTFDGLRRALLAVVPTMSARDEVLRASVRFLTWAVAIPCVVAVIWPWIAETTR